MGTPNFANRTLYHGDNLAFLRGMNSESVHLIATDPPFNKGKDFHATPDSLAAGARFQDRWSWANDVEQAWVDQIEDDWPAVHAVIGAAKTSYGAGYGGVPLLHGSAAAGNAPDPPQGWEHLLAH